MPLLHPDRYQRPQRRTAPLYPESSGPSGQGYIEWMRAKHPPQIDASAGLSESERAQVKEIKRLMADGSWGIGNTIPRKLLAAVYDGAIPQGMQLDLAPAVSMNASMDVQNRLAAKVEQSLQASLATDVAPPRRLATDGPQQRPLMSYKLKQLMEDYTWLNEDAFEAQMQKWGLTNHGTAIQYKKAQTQHLNHQPQTAWNTLPINEL